MSVVLETSLIIAIIATPMPRARDGDSQDQADPIQRDGRARRGCRTASAFQLTIKAALYTEYSVLIELFRQFVDIYDMCSQFWRTRVVSYVTSLRQRIHSVMQPHMVIHPRPLVRLASPSQIFH